MATAMDGAAERAGSKKKDGKAVPAAAAPAAPASPRKPKKARKRDDGETDQPGPSTAAAAPATPPSAPRKAAKVSATAAASGPAAATATPARPAAAAGKKRVQWSLKSNLVHAAGGPVPPATVRNPPGARPRGSALKTRSAVAPARKVKKGRMV